MEGKQPFGDWRFLSFLIKEGELSLTGAAEGTVAHEAGTLPGSGTKGKSCVSLEVGLFTGKGKSRSLG